MLDKIKNLFETFSENKTASSAEEGQNNVILAVCALFVEMARIDDTFTDEEQEKVLFILKEKYGLSGEHADALIAEADRELKESVDLWQFAKVINEQYTPDEKEKLVERLWQIVYVDGKMDEYEHYLMNKLSNLLRLSHKQLIDAKLKVLHG
jgi:uncharacterized tellurite resistance protein B-like protein